MIVGLFRQKDAKPKSMFFPEQSSSGVDPKRLAAGLLGKGEILSIEPAGRSWSIGPAALPAPFLDVTLQVRVEGIPPYPAALQQSIPGMRLSQFQAPGAIVPVRVNPEDQADVAIDFYADPPAVTGG
jgi:hypothetical protein